MNDMNTQMTDSGMPKHTFKIDDKAVKKLVGEAVNGVDGVLDVTGGLTDLLKGDDDKTRGVSVTVSTDNRAQVQVRIITEYGKNIPAIVDAVVGRVNESLHDIGGLNVEKVDVEITDTMTREQYETEKKSSLSSHMPGRS